jgi:uncharacterized protein
MNESLGDMADSARQKGFGQAKSRTLPKYCRECDVRFACNGECPKHRFIRTPDGEDGLNYLCQAYKKFFHHVEPFMKQMTNLLHSGRAPAEIKSLLLQQPDAFTQSSRGQGTPQKSPRGVHRK